MVTSVDQEALRYPYGPSAYFACIDAWRTSGTFDGLEFGTGERAAAS